MDRLTNIKYKYKYTHTKYNLFEERSNNLGCVSADHT